MTHITHTDQKFFTNEPGRDLYNRFASILKGNTQYFDALVGYFRSSGFFRLYEALESVEKIRILVGINVDRKTLKALDHLEKNVQILNITPEKGKSEIINAIEREFLDAPLSEETEMGVHVFMDWLKTGKLEMRMYTETPIHAKVYILRKDPIKVPDMFGSIITGSSNFSEAGLKNNFEFNVELKDYSDVKFALDKFEELWEKSVDIQDTYLDAINEKTWMRENITPYEIYLKTLYEFFKEEINADKEGFDTILPEGYMRLQYQIDAVAQARQKLDAYGGVFISDVVGLGKTYISAMLANSFNRNTYKLIICPPVLVDYWRSVLQEFDVARCDVESLGKLNNIIEKGTEKYSYVFVDEAHRFRNSDTESFTQLHQICRGKKVILITATPINNYSSDIKNQIFLFQAKKNGTINGIKDIEGFFRDLDAKLIPLERGSISYFEQMRANSEIIRDRLIREIMIRRTRGELRQYYTEDLQQRGLTFPKVGNPDQIVYTFDSETDDAFSQTIEVIKDFKYSRYTPLLYLKDVEKYATMLISQRNMGGFMKGLLVKRLESSFHAFRKTLERFIESYEKFITMAANGDVYISKKIDIYDLLDDGDDEKLLNFIEKNDVLHFESREFTSQFFHDLEDDLAKLKQLRRIWSLIDVDPKLDEFRKALQTNASMKGKKVIVFSESRETAEYLHRELSNLYGGRVIAFSGKSSRRLKEEIESSFNPQSKGHEDKYDLLITTDVLSEGINLHKANVIVNYDLPWNPTKILQRVGRINRVGTLFDRIHVFNFFPTAQSRSHLPLKERILEKLQAFHYTLGEDYKYLSEEEEVSPQKLFSKLTADLDEDEESINPELAYLTKIREIRDKEPGVYEKIKRLPRKARSARYTDKSEQDSTITFIRKGALKTFFKSDNSSTEQLSFMQAMEYVQSEINEKRTEVSRDYYEQFRNNNLAFDDFLLQELIVKTDRPKVTGNDAKIIKILKAIRADMRLTDKEEENINFQISLWENGEIPSKISKEIVKKFKGVTDSIELHHLITKMIPPAYLKRLNQDVEEGSEKQVVLSCYLKQRRFEK